MIEFLVRSLQSRTVQGILAALICGAFNKYGVAEFSDAETKALLDIISQLAASIALAFAWYGRAKAKGPFLRKSGLNISIVPLLLIMVMLSACANAPSIKPAQAVLISCRAYTFSLFELANLRMAGKLSTQEITVVDYWRPILNSICSAPAPSLDAKAAELMSDGVRKLLDIELAAKQGSIG